jgi:hypothetical protein
MTVAQTTATAFQLVTASSNAHTTSASTTTGTSAPSSTQSGKADNSTGSAGIGQGTIIGIVVGVITFLVLAAGAGLAYFCLTKRKSTPPSPQPNLIDLHTPSSQASNGASFYGKTESYPMTPVPQTPGASPWDAAPPYPQNEYWKPYQVPPTGQGGNVLVELENAVARPTGKNGTIVHELA